MTETTRPAHELPAVADLLEATERLTGPGSPFELVEEDVLGETMRVFRNRPRSLRDVLVKSFEFGDRDSMVFSDGRRITFAETEQQVASVAAYLQREHGIGSGDRVAICGANSAGWILSFWACISLGAVTVAMNGWWTEVEMHHALDLSEPKLILVDTKRAERMGETPGIPQVDLDFETDAMIAYDPSAAMPSQPIDEDDPVILIFTSGTTGRPKAAILAHRSVIAYGMNQSFIGARGLMMSGRPAPTGPPPVRLAVFPLFHVSGLGATVSGMMTGATGVWTLGRFDPATTIDLTVKEGIGIWGGTGTHVIRLLEHPDLDRIEPSQLQSVGMGGSATTPDIMRRLDTRLPHLAGTMSTGYGSTETGALVSWAPNWMIAASPECVGPPLPGVDVRIVDESGHDVPDGDEGNIAVRSPLVMLGYWRNPDADAEAFLPGHWFLTGDFGRMEGGLLYMATRRRDLIIRGGENIYPFEVEYRLDEHPDVEEAAVIGVDDDVLGQRVHAVVVLRAGATATEDELRAFCRETLSSYKVPESFEVRAEPLPRNPSGKVLKHVLSGSGEHTFVDE